MDNLLRVVITDDAVTNTCTVRLVGECDHYSFRPVHESLLTMAREKQNVHWVIDASGLEFADTSAITLIASLDQAVDGLGSLAVIPTPHLEKMLQVSGLADRWAGRNDREAVDGAPS